MLRLGTTSRHSLVTNLHRRPSECSSIRAFTLSSPVAVRETDSGHGHGNSRNRNSKLGGDSTSVAVDASAREQLASMRRMFAEPSASLATASSTSKRPRQQISKPGAPFDRRNISIASAAASTAATKPWVPSIGMPRSVRYADADAESDAAATRATSTPLFTNNTQHTHQTSNNSPTEIIRKKRNGAELSNEEIHWFVNEFHNNSEVKDYQMTALLMAICVRGMSNREAMDLTAAMLATGSRVDLSKIQMDKPKVDKHSTGGVGDKCSLVLAPLAASLGLVVPMVCNTGQGHTGGTIDKLSSIPGLHTDLTTEEYTEQLAKVGCVIADANKGFAPVDCRMNALRDVTGCSDNVALVASSIMSKKIAESPNALLLDIKTGRGALFPRLVDALSLAQTMVAIGENEGIPTRCILSRMDQPLGSAVGNWLEVREAIQVLSSGRIKVAEPTSDAILEEVRELALVQAAMMLQIAGKVANFSEGWEQANDMLESGECINMLAKMVQSQGGDARVIFDPERIPLSPLRCTLYAPDDCIVKSIDAYEIGMASIWAGAGRFHVEDQLDLHAGFLFHAKVGDAVKKGEPLLTAFVGPEKVHNLADPIERLERGFQRAVEAIQLVKDQPSVIIPRRPLVEYVVDKTDTVPFFEYCADR